MTDSLETILDFAWETCTTFRTWNLLSIGLIRDQGTFENSRIRSSSFLQLLEGIFVKFVQNGKKEQFSTPKIDKTKDRKIFHGLQSLGLF